jgi:hypothetical protein
MKKRVFGGRSHHQGQEITEEVDPEIDTDTPENMTINTG